jgi:ankyrin repeat protein
MIEDEEDVEEEPEEEMKEEEKNERLLKACKENNLEEAQYFIQVQAMPTYEKDGWTPLLWAAMNGNEEIVRLLIRHNACAPYLNQNQDDMMHGGSPSKGNAARGVSIPG